MMLYAQLQVFSPPEAGEPWVDHLGALYQPVDDHHVGSGFVTKEHVVAVRASESKLPEGQAGNPQVFPEWPTGGSGAGHRAAAARVLPAGCGPAAIKAGYLTEDHEVKPLPRADLREPGTERARAPRWTAAVPRDGAPDRVRQPPAHQQAAGSRGLSERPVGGHHQRAADDSRCQTRPGRICCWCWRATSRWPGNSP